MFLHQIYWRSLRRHRQQHHPETIYNHCDALCRISSFKVWFLVWGVGGRSSHWASLLPRLRRRCPFHSSRRAGWIAGFGFVGNCSCFGIVGDSFCFFVGKRGIDACRFSCRWRRRRRHACLHSELPWLKILAMCHQSRSINFCYLGFVIAFFVRFDVDFATNLSTYFDDGQFY